VPSHRVTYVFEGSVPDGYEAPVDENTYVKGEAYTVAGGYEAVATKDAYGNVNGRYTFTGWADPNNGTMGDADVTVTGTWVYAPITVPAHRVTYVFEGNVPAGYEAPVDENTYVKGEAYTVAGGYETVETKDAYGNVNGRYTFTGWADPNNGTMGDADVTVTGTWVYEAIPVEPETPPVAPKTGTIVLTKVDAADENTTLENVVFELYRAGGILEGIYVTGADGTITVEDLSAGKYYWLEVRPAEGYLLDTSRHFFTVFDNRTTRLTVTNTRTAIPEAFSGDHYAYVIGYADGLVRPEANITRAQVATIFFRLLTDEVREQYLTKENAFADVSADMWYNTAVSTMAAMGIINGYPDGNFHPNANITRAEFAAIAARFDTNSNSTGGASFADIYGHWAQKEIDAAYQNGWILGYTDGTFRPDQSITRAEAMTMINRVLQRVPENENDLLEDMVVWPDNMDIQRWYYLAVQEATNSHDYQRKESGYEYWTNLKEIRDWSVFER